MNKNPELTEQTKQNIVQAFWSLYAEKDMNQISVKEITERAGYNRSTFYAYFGNTDEVLEYVVEELYSSARKMGLGHGCKDTVTQVNETTGAGEITHRFVQFYSEYKKYLSVLFGKMQAPVFTKRLWELAEPHYSEYLEELSPKQRVEIPYAIEYNLCGMFMMIAKWHKNGQDIPIERLEEILKILSQQGVRNCVDEIMEKHE